MPDKTRPTRQPHGGGGGPSTGPAVDAHGGPVIDPTENVIALTKAEAQRQDDLRAATDLRFSTEIGHLKELASLRAEHAAAMMTAEASRLNSIRQVDQANVNTAADRALAAIQTLAATTNQNAENLRSALTSTATTIATQTTNTVAQINERIAALEKSSYEGKGKQAYVDPMMTELLDEVKRLREQRALGTGRTEGLSSAWALLISAVMLIGGLITVGTFLFITRPSQAPASATPVIYTPAPSGTQLPVLPPGQVPR